MIYMKVYLPLAKDEFEAIEKIASKEMRGFREQVRFLLRDALIERGEIAPDPSNALAANLQTR